MQYAYDNVHSTPFSLQSSSSSNPVNPDSDVYLLSESGFAGFMDFQDSWRVGFCNWFFRGI
jgi:hypothetical protein